MANGTATGSIVRDEGRKARDRAAHPINLATGKAPTAEAIAKAAAKNPGAAKEASAAKARKPAEDANGKRARATAAHKRDAKAPAPATRPTTRAVTDALGGAATRTFAIRITTAELDAIHKAAGVRGACRFARDVMAAFASHDGKAFAKVVKAAKANGGQA